MQGSVQPTFHKAILQESKTSNGSNIDTLIAQSPDNLLPSSPEIKRQFEGNIYNGYNPSDNTLAISNEGWMVSVVNSSVSFYNEDGSNTLNSEDLNTFYSYLNFPDYFFNPRVLFDPVGGKFILITLHGKTPETSRIIISFSFSQNPADGWWTYTFDDIAGSTGTWMNDLQTGVSAEDLFVAGNLYETSGALSNSIILQLDKEQGFEGQNLSYSYWGNVVNETGQAVGSITPVSHGLEEGYGPGIYLLASKADGGSDLLLFEIDNDNGNSPLLFRYTIQVSPYSPGNNGTQPGTSKLLNVGDCRIQSAFFADGLIHYVHHDRFIDGSNGIRYGKLDPVSQNNAAQLFGQSGNTYAFPAIAPFFNGIGNFNTVLMGFCRTSSSVFPQFNVVTIAEDFSSSALVSVKTGATSITTPAGSIVPWGHYSGISRRHNSLIPSVWVLGSYGKSNQYGNWVAEVAPLGSGPNLPCEEAEELFCGTTQINTTSGNSQTLPECGISLNTAPGRWFRIVGYGGNMTLSTCSAQTNFNTKIGVFSGACYNLTCITAADDAGCTMHPTNASVTFYAVDGEEYFIYVTGSGTASGTFEISVQCDDLAGTCSGNQVFTNCSGTLSDGSDNNPYSNNLNCSWTISPTAATSVTLTFTAFETEENFDYISVYDGTSENDLLLGSYSGSSLPGALTANSGSMYIVFESDGSATSSGWNADYICTALQAPVADFAANPVSGTAPFTVNFNNLSTNPPASYLWDFGDNSTSTVANPSHTYSFPGTYTVKLTAANIAGNNTKIRTDFIIVIPNAQAPVAAYNTSAVCGQSTLTVNFQDQSTNSPNSWFWEFGDGQTSSQQNPIYTYPEPGIYSVKLTAGNIAGSDIEIKTSLITVLAPMSVTAINGNNGCIGTPVTLQASGANSYTWSGTGINNSTENPVMVNPVSPGNYTYTVIGTSNSCVSSPVSITINFFTPPVITLNTSSVNACFGQTIQLSASGASSYVWSGAGLSGLTGSVITASAAIPGTYTYTLTGTSNGCASVPAAVTVSFAPIPLVSVGISTGTSCLGTPTTLTASGAATYQWSGIGLLQTTGAQVNANPALPGSYAYQVIGTLDGCLSPPQTVSLQFNSVPLISLTPTFYELCAGQSLLLTATGANTYTWEGPGLNGVTFGSVTVSPPVGETVFTVRGTVNGCQSAPQSALITVTAVPMTVVTGNENPVCLGDTIWLTAGGAMQYQWSGPNLLSSTGTLVAAVPSQPGISNYQVTGVSGSCIGQTINVPATVLNNPLSVTVSESGCPGPNLMYTATVINGTTINNITWYVNGIPVWAGPSYTLLNAANGDQLYCTAAPLNAPLCTQPAVAASDIITVECITVSTHEVQVIGTMSIVPNPNNGLFELQITALEPKRMQIQIFNTIGQLIFRQPIEIAAGSGQYPMDMSTLPAGIYWMVAASDNQQQIMRLIKD